MKKNLVCKICGQKFAMPPHLGRHMKAVHNVSMTGAPAKKGKKGKRAGAKRAGAPSPMSAALVASDDFSETLNAYCAQLTAQRERIDQQLSALQGAISSMGGSAAVSRPAKRKRARRAKSAAAPKAAVKPKARKGKSGTKSGGYRPGSLNDMILKVLKETGKSMSIAEIESAVLKAGYKTKSKKLADAINNTMGKLKGAKRVERGVYRAA
ncbi:MAG: hypothetical protein BroJett003_05020 [Planctomycetota bacterium]|nr:MAG: hypothetical protein BroJett003_05020 [Planctomycetota bacterium]